jgi:hypothetical protein
LVITGVLFIDVQKNGIEVKATGNNLLQLPSPDGLFLTGATSISLSSLME